MTRRTVAIVVAWLALVGVSAIHTQERGAEFSFGSVTIVVPPPAGYTEVFATNPSVREFFLERLKISGAAVLAGYAPTTALPGLRSTGPSALEGLALLATSPELRSTEITMAMFDSMAIRLRTGYGDVLKRTQPDLDAALAAMRERLAKDIRLERPVPVGVPDDRPNRFSILTAMPFSIEGSPVPILVSNTLIRARNRLLFLYMYRMSVDSQSAADLVAAARTWTDVILAANAERGPNQPR